MMRGLGGLSVLLLTASCGGSGSRPDAAVSMGSAGGAGASSGSGGATFGGGTGGTGVDGAADGPLEAGEADGPGAVWDATEGGAALEPIRVFGGNPDASVAYHDLRFVGAHLEQYEGAVVTFRIGSSAFWRLGSGQARVVQGAFDVLFPQVVAPVYESKLAHIDADGNGACDVGEPAFFDSGLYQANVTLTVTPDDFRFRPAVSGWCDGINSPPAP